MFSSNILIKMFAYIGANFIVIAHLSIGKKFVQLNIKLLSVSINLRKLIITLDRRFFVLGLFQRLWDLPLREKCPNTELFLVRVFLYLD